jgi:hypothetical protein
MLVFSKTENDEKFFKQFLFLTLLFFFVKIPYLTQEYGYEEALWVDGGLKLLNTGLLEFSWGLSAPAITGFHKPPLFHLLMGITGKIFGENEVSYRMIPLLFSYVGFYFGLRLVYLWQGSVLLFGCAFIALPFFFLGNNQVNVDGSLMVFGYTFLLWLFVDILRGQEPLTKKQKILFSGIICFLFATRGLGLFFSFCILLSILGYRYFFQTKKIIKQDWDLIAWFLIGSIGGAVFMTVMSLWAKGNLQGWVDWYQWCVGQKEGFSARATSLWAWILRVFDFLGVLQRRGIIWFLLIPAILLVMAYKKNFKNQSEEKFPIHVLLLIFLMIPTGFYLFAGANPYGFPRYFLPPMMIGMIVLCTPTLGPKSYRFFCWVLLISSLAHIPKLHSIYQDRGARTEWKGQKGFKEAAQFLKQTLPENSVIVAMSSAGYYFGGNYLDNEALSYKSADEIGSYFEKYPIKAWVFQPTDEGDFPKGNPLYPHFEKAVSSSQNTIIKTIGTLKVYIFNCQVQCGS